MNKKDNSRSKKIKYSSLIILILFLVGTSTLFLYLSRDSNQFINYNENSNANYKVYLKDNDFYDVDYLEKDQGYIASLIKSIDSKFEYKMNFMSNVKYKYSYRIAAEIEVNDDLNDNSIYHFSEDLINKKDRFTIGQLNIAEELKINYDEYNNKIKKFKEVYDLKNTSSNLNINLYVHLYNINDSNTSLNERKVSSLTIPLTENTVSIDINDDNVSNENNRIELNNYNNYSWLLLISGLSLLIAIIYLLYLITYIKKTRTAQMIYQKEIRSIMNNYDSYIQRINGSYDIGTSQVIKIESFNDMLEIRDTLKQPILMLENDKKDGTFFIIPATNSIIYTYALRIVDITAKMEGKEIPTYDITEIPHDKFIRKKKYTDEYIKDQITMTTLMPKVDEKNTIKGKNSKESLYDQLEKTSSFDVVEIRKQSRKAVKVTESYDDIEIL